MAKREIDKDQANAPGRGHKTPADIEAIFATEYLRTGIVTQAAKKARISAFTGYEIADRLDQNEEFARRRKALFTRGLDEVEASLLDCVDTARKRIKAKPVITEVGVIDNGPNWMRSLTDLHRSLVARRKLEHDVAPENKPQWPTEVHIVYKEGSEESGPSQQ